MHFVRRGDIHGTVANEHPAECTGGVAGQCVHVGLFQRRTRGASASVVVLEDGERRIGILEFLHQLHGGVDVQQVVVREGLAVKWLEQGIEVAKELGLLVRVFTVAQALCFRHTQVQRLHLSLVDVMPAQVRVNHGVVVRTHPEPSGGQGLSLVKRCHSIVAKDVEQRAVIRHGRNDDHVLKVLRRPADQGDSTDVDFLDDVCLGSAACHGGLKRVQVHHHEVDGGQGIFLHLEHVAIVFPPSEDAAKHLGMEGFDPAAQDGGIVCDGFHRDHLRTHRFNGRLRAPCRIDGHAESFQFFHDGLEAILVKNGNEGRTDLAWGGHEVGDLKGANLRCVSRIL